MTRYEPNPERDSPPPAGSIVGVLLVAILAVLLSQCSEAAKPPYELILPDGSSQQACAPEYIPDAKVFVFVLCPTVFSDSFEGDK